MTLAIDLFRVTERVYALAALAAVGSDSIVKTPIFGRNEKAALMAVADMELTEIVAQLYPHVRRTEADDTDVVHLDVDTTELSLVGMLEQLTALRTYARSTADAVMLRQADAKLTALHDALRISAMDCTGLHLTPSM